MGLAVMNSPGAILPAVHIVIVRGHSHRLPAMKSHDH